MPFCFKESLMRRSRNFRRHHLKRIKSKRKKKGNWLYFDQDDNIRHINCALKTGKICSCVMCGNARKYFNELTIQEKKAIISEMEQITEAREEKSIE